MPDRWRETAAIQLLGAASVVIRTMTAGPQAIAHGDVWILHTYNVTLRLKERISITEVQASDAGQAKKLVEAQCGKDVTVLSTKGVQQRSSLEPGTPYLVRPLY